LIRLRHRASRLKVENLVNAVSIENVEAASDPLREAEPSKKRAKVEQNLAAWLVPVQPEAPPSVNELRALAVAALPSYMVPASLVLMGSLPTTSIGKLGRRALPDPRRAGQQSGTV
jgi:nonribosomal peptide synthetase DhbF